ncbi:MAG: hypothetical protein DSM106950_04805 [Stigonema ocellatum SAG 48.90 = DSM 106950]|nr:hypothetical protein [Stigonema ocellatum SAG 48.90 = DSM 106950]
MGIAADMLSKFGLEALLIAIYIQRLSNGESRSKLCQEIQQLPIFDDLKRVLREAIGCNNTGNTSLDKYRS